MDLWAPTSRLDRVEEQRDPAWVREVWAGGVVLDVDLDGNLACDAAGTGLAWRDPREPYDAQRHLLLGLVDGVPHFAQLSEEPGATASLRALGAHLDDTDNDLAATALALVNWHLVAPYCGVCGGPTIVRHGGDVRYCPHCERDRFPRTDPAVIVAILDPAGRLLLGHHAGWDERRVSILAGFVSAGESLEQAVQSLGHVAEGVYCAQTVWQRAQHLGVDMPITECVVGLLAGALKPVEVVAALMGRDPKGELL